MSQIRHSRLPKCLILVAVSGMLLTVSLARAAPPSNTTVSMQSEFVKGAYVNMTGTHPFGTIYRNGTISNEQVFNGSQYFDSYTVTASNSTHLNLTSTDGVVNNVTFGVNRLRIPWPTMPNETIDAPFPYTNDTSAQDYVRAFQRIVYSPVENVSASVTNTTYLYRGIRYAAINATVSGYAFGYLNYYPQYPSVYTVIFSQYSGITFYQSLNITTLLQNSSINGSLPPIATQYGASIFHLNSTNIAMRRAVFSLSYLDILYVTSAATAATVGIIVAIRRRRSKL